MSNLPQEPFESRLVELSSLAKALGHPAPGIDRHIQVRHRLFDAQKRFPILDDSDHPVAAPWLVGIQIHGGDPGRPCPLGKSKRFISAPQHRLSESTDENGFAGSPPGNLGIPEHRHGLSARRGVGVRRQDIVQAGREKDPDCREQRRTVRDLNPEPPAGPDLAQHAGVEEPGNLVADSGTQ